MEGTGLRLATREQKSGMSGCSGTGSSFLCDPLHLPLPHPKRVKERRPESVEVAELHTPLENQERTFSKRNKNLREK